jgi:DNA-binding NarL/FixJ family response regulator
MATDIVAMDPRPAGHALPISAILAEGQRLVRAGVRRLFEDQRDISIIGEAATGEQLLALAAELKPDVVVMDVALPDLDGFEVARQVVAEAPPGGCRVVVLIDADRDESMLAALEAGASGVLDMDSDAAELLRAVRVVAGGDVVLGPEVTRSLISHVLARRRSPADLPTELSELTAREREVVGLVADGLSNAEIAERLVVTPSTAKTHVSRASRKLGARDRAQLVVYAYESGLVRARSWPRAAHHGAAGVVEPGAPRHRTIEHRTRATTDARNALRPAAPPS